MDMMEIIESLKNRILNLVDELKEVGVQAISIVAVGDPLVYPHMKVLLKDAFNIIFIWG